MNCKRHTFHGYQISDGKQRDTGEDGYWVLPYSHKKSMLGRRHYYRNNIGGPFPTHEIAVQWGATWVEAEC